MSQIIRAGLVGCRFVQVAEQVCLNIFFKEAVQVDHLHLFVADRPHWYGIGGVVL
jgi:hypothetical protein